MRCDSSFPRHRHRKRCVVIARSQALASDRGNPGVKILDLSVPRFFISLMRNNSLPSYKHFPGLPRRYAPRNDGRRWRYASLAMTSTRS